VDSLAPNVTLLTPANATNTTVRTINLTANISDILGLENATLYVYNHTGDTTDEHFFDTFLGGTLSATVGVMVSFVDGVYTWFWEAFDTSGNLEVSENRTLTISNILENSQTYNPTTVETAIENFALNVSYSASDWSAIIAKLNYNNTFYTGTKVGTGSTVSFTRSLEVPNVDTTTAINLNWTIGLTNASGTYYFNSTTGTQTVYLINMSLCGDPYDVAFMNFTVYDEATGVELNGTIDLTFDYSYITGTSSQSFSFSNNTGSEEYDFCIDPPQFNYSIDAILEYTAPGYIQRFYNFNNLIVTNTTTSMSLYLLNSSDSTSFIIELKDASYVPIVGAEIYIQRYDTGSGDWITTEIVGTNVDGEAIGHLFTEDTLYRFKIYEDGILIYTTGSTTISCPAAPCTVTIIIPEDSDWINPYTPLDDLTYDLTYEKVTHIVTYTYEDTSDNFTQGRLQVLKHSAGVGYSLTPICNSTSAISSAVITCDLSGETNGTYTASGYITRDDTEQRVRILVIDKMINIVETVGLDGVLWSMFLLIGILMLGVYKPSLGIIFAIVGVVGMYLLKLMAITTTAIVAIVGIGGILLWQLKSQ